jgi:selenide,water dikinase
VLVDHRTGDDAGVFRLDATTALVQTVDFFTPVVDEPSDFGAIAAANALSDVYAMGGRPLTALSIAAFPEADFPPEWAADIVRGGQAKLKEAGCALLGGHSVRDPEIKFGYAITGLVDPARMMTNARGRPGEVLVLTKALGTGIVSTALKAGEAPPEAVAAATASMARLNAAAAAAALRAGVRAATDVTGFGLLGHTHELAFASGLAAEIDAAAVPAIDGVLELLSDERALAGGSNRNRADADTFTTWGNVPDPLRRLVCDAMTSGGLLAALPPGAEIDGWPVGRLVAGPPGALRVS